MKIDTKNPVYVVIYAVVVSAVFTAAIMSLNAFSRSAVQRNQKLAEDKAFVELFNLGDIEKLSPDRIVALREEHVIKGPAVEVSGTKTGVTIETLLARQDGKITAIAIPIGGVGFWAPIKGYLALSPDLTTVEGVVFLEHSETPGLGGRLTEKKWRDRFKGLKIPPPDKDIPKLIYIDNSSSPSKQDRHVDAITGATGTSSGVEKFLNAQLMTFLDALGDNPAEKFARLISHQKEDGK